MSVEKQERPSGLVRGLGLLDATMIVVGSMIGSGIFLTSAASARFVGAPGWLLAAWALAGVLTITGALCCAELATMWPRAGGQYVFLREAYSPAVGFLFGWALFLVIQTGTIAAVAIGFAKFTGVIFTRVSSTNYLLGPFVFGRYALSLSTQQLVAILVIMLLTWTNMRGLKTGKLVQNSFTLTKTAALIGLIVIGLTLGWRVGMRDGGAAFASSWWDSWANNWSPARAQAGLAASGFALALLLGRAMVGPIFAQSAWNNVTFTGSEIREPGRNLPRALLTGCGLVVFLYLLANLAYVLTLPLDAIQNAPQDRVAGATMQAILGSPGTVIMAVAIMISTFGCNNGLILAGARVYYAMARDRLFFRRAGQVNARHVPAFALLAQGVWASLLTLPRTVKTTALRPGEDPFGDVYTQLLDYIVSADLIFYALMVAAVLIMRRKAPDLERPYKTFGYPFVPLIYILLALLLILDLAYLTFWTAGIGYLIVLTGIPVYLVWRRKS